MTRHWQPCDLTDCSLPSQRYLLIFHVHGNLFQATTAASQVFSASCIGINLWMTFNYVNLVVQFTSHNSQSAGNWMLLLQILFYVLSCFQFHCWNHSTRHSGIGIDYLKKMNLNWEILNWNCNWEILNLKFPTKQLNPKINIPFLQC